MVDQSSLMLPDEHAISHDMIALQLSLTDVQCLGSLFLLSLDIAMTTIEGDGLA